MFNYTKFHDDSISQLEDIGKKTLKRRNLDVRQLGVVGCGSDWVRAGQSGSEWVRVDQSGSEWIRVGQSGSEWVRARFSTARSLTTLNF